MHRLYVRTNIPTQICFNIIKNVEDENERKNVIKLIEPKPNENPLETKKFITFKYFLYKYMYEKVASKIS